jgi:integrase
MTSAKTREVERMTARNDALTISWLAWLESGNLSPNTLRLRRHAIARFAAGRDLTAVTTADIVAYLAAQPGGDWSRAGHLAAIRSFYLWAHGTGLMPANPALMVRSIKVHERSRPPLPSSVLDQAIVHATDDLTRNALLLGSRAGLRRAEIAAFHSSNVRGDCMTIVGKGGKERTIPLHPDLEPLAADLRRSPGWLFPSHVKPGEHVTPETIQRAVSAALGPPWTTHDLRRHAATQWYDRGGRDLRAVQELLGHSDPETTVRYVRPNMNAMRRAVLAVA